MLQSHRLISWNWVANDVASIEAFLQNGPVVTAFTVYEDFFSYSGGIYRHTWGDVAGGHCVAIVGYDNTERYWIVKNSWGPGWGEGGWFRIGFGECGIEDAVAALTVPSVGTITLDGSAYSHLQFDDYFDGSYTATANAPQGSSFLSWQTSGDVTVSDTYSQTTTVFINGIGSLTANFEFPDLTVENVWVDHCSAVQSGSAEGPLIKKLSALGELPSIGMQPGEEFCIFATVKNIGRATTYGYYIDAYYDSNYGWGGSVYSIAPDEVHTWSWGPWTAESGTHTTSWIVDPGNMIQELDETNNGKTYEFTVSTPPTLQLLPAQVSGLTVTINGVALPGTPGAWITRINSDWGDGTSQDVSFPATHTYSKGGTYTIVVTAFQSDGLSTSQRVELPTLVAPPPQVKSKTIFDNEFSGVRVKVEWRESGHRRTRTLATPFSLDLRQGLYKFTAPSTVRVGGVQYRFAHWEDETRAILSGSRTLSYNVQPGKTLYAVYGPRQYRLTVEVKVSGARVAGATVEVTQLGHTYTAVTNSRGKAVIGGIYAGQPFNLKITINGIVRYERTLTITKNTTYRAYLTPA
jgi:hypothetical protein